MTPAERNDLKQLAMLAELARPLSHECNNFLNNLLLQLAISEQSFPESMRAEWVNLRQEARKLAGLFQQWQRQRKQNPDRQTRVEFNQLIDDSAEEIRSEPAPVHIRTHPADQPLWFMGSVGELQRLVSMEVHYAAAALLGTGVDDPALDLHVAYGDDRILLYLVASGSPTPQTNWPEFDAVTVERNTGSLTSLACNSLAERLQGYIRVQRNADGCSSLVLDIPRAVS